MENNVPQYKDLEVVRKTTKNYELQFTKNGQMVDITDYSVYFTVKTNMNDNDASSVINKTVTSHSEPTKGITLIQLTTSDTDIDAGNYYYSIDYKDDDDNQQVLFTGRIRVIEPVRKTRA